VRTGIASFFTQIPHKIVQRMAEKRTPSDFLKAVIGRPVIVKLNSGVEYRGMSAAVYAADVS